MTDIIIPLLDHSNKDNMENFNNISSMFFKEYDKQNKGYIEMETLEELINEIKNHFFKKSFGIIKLKILISLFNNYDPSKLKIVNKIIDNIIEINVKKIFELLSKNNKIILEDFKNIVVLLLLCIVDTAIDYETEKKSNVLLLPFNNENDFDSDLLNLDSDSDSDSKSVTLDELIETIITDILSSFNENIININELKESILEFFEHVIIEDKKLTISNNDIDNFLINNNLNNEKYVKKIKIKHLLVNFITHILDKNDVL